VQVEKWSVFDNLHFGEPKVGDSPKRSASLT